MQCTSVESVTVESISVVGILTSVGGASRECKYSLLQCLYCAFLLQVYPMTDYERIRRSCLKRGELWEDPEFPATQASVFYHQTPPFQFVWKRPKVRNINGQAVVCSYQRDNRAVLINN